MPDRRPTLALSAGPLRRIFSAWLRYQCLGVRAKVVGDFGSPDGPHPPTPSPARAKGVYVRAQTSPLAPRRSREGERQQSTANCLTHGTHSCLETNGSSWL